MPSIFVLIGMSNCILIKVWSILHGVKNIKTIYIVRT